MEGVDPRMIHHIEATYRRADVVLDVEVVIQSHQENVCFEGAIGTKRLRKTSLQGSVPVHKPNTSNPSLEGVCTHLITIFEGDATRVVNVNQFTYSHTVTAKTAGRLCYLKG